MIEALFAVISSIVEAVLGFFASIVEWIASFFLAGAEAVGALELVGILLVFCVELLLWGVLWLAQLLRALARMQRVRAVSKPVLWRPAKLKAARTRSHQSVNEAGHSQ